MLSRKPHVLIGITLYMLFQVPNLASGQYFGRNKVQYEDFDFRILQTEHFAIHHYPQTAKAIEDIGMLSERWYKRYSTMLNHTFDTRNPVIFYANHADFQQTDIISQIGIGTGGVTEGLRNRVIMPFAESFANTNHVLGHELVHAFQYDIARGEDIGGVGATSRLPLWFIEGMAEYLSVGPADTETAMWLRDAVLNDDIPSIDDLSNTAEYFPYRYGHAVWAFIAGTWGDETVSELYVASATGGLENGFNEILGLSADSVSTLWHNSVREQYSDVIQEMTRPKETGELILGEEKGTGAMNISPSLSPGGEYVAFISEKNIFSLELYLADAQTGEIIRKLTTTVANPHMNALQFIESAGSWSPDGNRFAAVAFIKGDNEIIIVDVEEGGVLQSLAFDEVGSISNPAWSPDGNRIAFSGSEGGYSDLYIYNFETDSLRNITADPYSDLQPEWSPDGSKIAFVTDRGPGTDFDELIFGKVRIAILDLSTGSIDMVPEFYDAKHINPQFSPDGNSLYYVSDYQGFSNIYRYDFQNGQRYQVTNVATGVSGIGNLSPAITVADNSGELMATVFDNTNYSVYKIPEKEKQGRQLINFAASPNSNRLPVLDGADGRVASYLQNPATDLPADTAFTLTDYVPDVQLEYVGAGGGIGVSNRFGVGAVGGVNLYFSDMLRQHQLYTNLQLQGQLRDLGGQITYLNTDRRFIWGLSMGHFSFLSRATGTAVDTVQIDEETAAQVLRIDQLNRRIFLNTASAVGMYPFSQTQRLEFNIGYQRISYDLELVQNYVSPDGSFIFDRETEDLEAPSALDLANGSIAYVEDNSISAFTGPIRGHRLRFEIGSTTGSLTYLTALADYRRYFHMRPFTLAFRGLHYGRYLDDAESDRLSPNFLGYESLVRGYNIASFDPMECSGTPGGDCPEFSRLVGSRMAVANAEIRLPILGIEDLALFRTRFLPTTFTAFFDAGMTWTQDEAPVIAWERESTERIPVFSSGVSLRFNILGYLIAELYYAIPFQRPEKGGYIGFHLAPGW